MTGCYSDETSDGLNADMKPEEELDNDHVICFLDCTIPRNTEKSELPEHLWLI